MPEPIIQTRTVLKTAAEVIIFYKGDIPDWGSRKQKVSFFLHSVMITEELYLKSLELMENAKHIY